MIVYRVIEAETNKIVSEGYAWELEVEGKFIPDNTVRNNSRYCKLYLNRYQIISLGDDGKKRKKKLSKQELGMDESDQEIRRRVAKSKKKKEKDLEPLERDNEKAREIGLSYGHYKLHEQLGDLDRYARLHAEGIA